MSLIRKLILNTVAIVCLQQIAFGQNNNSPYSIYGIGDIEQSSFDRTSGMGHSGSALSSNRFMYNSNPASLSGLDDKFFNFEMATRAEIINYTGNPIAIGSDASSDLQVKKMSLAIKVKPKWGISAGILPYSTANYSFTANKYIQGADNVFVPAYYVGTGSINQFYVSNGYKLFKNFSVGLQSSYLFGQLKQTESISPTYGVDSALVTTRNVVVGSLFFKPGFQYNFKLNNDWRVYLGGTATIKTTVNGIYNLSVVYGNSTLPPPQNTILTNFKNNVITIPPKYTGSLAAKIKDKYTVSVDYSFQNWSNSAIQGVNYKLVNSNFLGIGFEVAKKQRFKDIIFERHFWQAGFFVSNSYVQVAGQQIENYGVTFGGGKNFLKSNLGLQLNVEVGVNGTTNAGLIQENYAKINLILSYRDFWYVKIKKFD